MVGPLESHVQAVSENHRVYGHRLNDRDIWLYTLTLAELSEQQYRDLTEFHNRNGVKETWIYTASDGATVSDARFVDVALQWVRTNSRLWALQVRFQGGRITPASA